MKLVVSSAGGWTCPIIAAGYEDEEQDVTQAYDSLAANLGIDHFSVMLRRASKQEQDDLLGQAKRPK